MLQGAVQPLADSDIIAALRAGQLRIVFQPQYTLPGLQLQGFEALVRLSIGNDALISPDQFLPLADAAGLMGALTLHMIEAACRTLRAWRESGRQAVFIAVNIESDDLDDILFAPRVCRLLAEYRVRPGELELELVERRFLRLRDVSRTNIGQLRSAGIRLAMDDFGTGSSALSQLADLPFDIIKIDKGFLSRVPTDGLACTLLASVINMCLALHKEVVIEGVESDAQLRWLGRLRWHWIRVQGNGLCLPLLEAQAGEQIPRTARLPGPC
jgi:EAL domain-containing protein (putative c-di-GMP-specific phosphodiesterase class I)